ALERVISETVVIVKLFVRHYSSNETKSVRPEEAASFPRPSRRTLAGHIATEIWNHSSNVRPIGMQPRHAVATAKASVIAEVLGVSLVWRQPNQRFNLTRRQERQAREAALRRRL